MCAGIRFDGARRRDDGPSGGERGALAVEALGVAVGAKQVDDDAGTVRAVNYARALEYAHIEAVYFATDPENVQDVADRWWDAGVDVPLSFVEAPFRDLGPPLLEEVRRHTARRDTIVTVVIPEFLVTRWWEHLLHGQTALFIKQQLLAEPQTVVVSVPYRVPRS